jgi:hypothetical protein
MNKVLGKISSVRFGSGGYQDAQFGIWFSFEGDGCGCGYGRGVWQGDPSSHANWSMTDKQKVMGEVMLYIEKIMEQAKCSEVHELKGKPVELSFEGNRLADWRILTEVI